MKRVALFYVFLLLWLQSAGAQSIITIEVYENGNALWNIEKRLPLPNQAAIDDWNGFIQKGHDQEQYRNDTLEFSSRIEWFIHSAENITNRSMWAANFNISYGTTKTLSGDFGVVRYSFDWKKFSKVASKKIYIGDVFSEEMFLTGDNVLVLKIPDGYEVISTSPNYDKRDGNRLIWDGTLYRSFRSGEPAIVLSPLPSDNGTWLIAGALAVLTGGSSMLLFRKKRTAKPAPESIEYFSPLPPLTEEELQYEEMIERVLIKSGGQAYQSDIVKEIGVSKSKISIVLARMKEDGRILKIRKGKENLIRHIVNK
ncbi:MAG: hypothetical protein WA102_01900 [Candidatus Methanoperedens sp.]